MGMRTCKNHCYSMDSSPTRFTELYNRVESGSDDPDNLGHLGHFFGGSSGSDLQAKLSGCDPDITCSLENNIGIW